MTYIYGCNIRGGRVRIPPIGGEIHAYEEGGRPSRLLKDRRIPAGMAKKEGGLHCPPSLLFALEGVKEATSPWSDQTRWKSRGSIVTSLSEPSVEVTFTL